LRMYIKEEELNERIDGGKPLRPLIDFEAPSDELNNSGYSRQEASDELIRAFRSVCVRFDKNWDKNMLTVAFVTHKNL
jgi:hypothetical protein